MIYPTNTLETFKIIEICLDCVNFNNEFRTEKYLTCGEKKELYRDYATNCCKFYYNRRKKYDA